jgi:hypothetical protein
LCLKTSNGRAQIKEWISVQAVSTSRGPSRLGGPSGPGPDRPGGISYWYTK